MRVKVELMVAGQVFLDSPMETPNIPTWNRIDTALPNFINDLETLLTENRIFKQRTVDIGIVSNEDALNLLNLILLLSNDLKLILQRYYELIFQVHNNVGDHQNLYLALWVFYL